MTVIDIQQSLESTFYFWSSYIVCQFYTVHLNNVRINIYLIKKNVLQKK
jgi:hypothetical protein